MISFIKPQTWSNGRGIWADNSPCYNGVLPSTTKHITHLHAWTTGNNTKNALLKHTNQPFLLRSFWADVFSLLSSVTLRHCPGTPELALLLIGIDDVPKTLRLLVSNILHAAWLTIARNWKSSKIPALLEVNAIVYNIFLHERTLAWHRGSFSSFQTAWTPWCALFLNLNEGLYGLLSSGRYLVLYRFTEKCTFCKWNFLFIDCLCSCYMF